MTTKEFDFYSLVNPERGKQPPGGYGKEQDSGEVPDFYSLARPQSKEAVTIQKPEEEFPDFYSMARPEKPSVFAVKPYGKDVYDIYRPAEKTPEELKRMTLKEKMEYRDELNHFREMQQSKGFTKGALSGMSFGLSKKIPGLGPEEEDLMTGLGEAVGSLVPITGLYKALGAPLVYFAGKSPVAAHGLQALARMTGFGLTGAAHKGIEDIVKGEIPTPEELGKEAATWVAIDAGLQGLGLGVSFSRAVRNIAKSEGVTSREVLGKLWDATKRRFKPSILPTEITETEVEALAEEAAKTERQGLRDVEIEVEPIKEKPVETKAAPAEKAPTVSEKPVEAEIREPPKPIAVKPEAEAKLPESIDLTGMGKGIADKFYIGVYDALEKGKDTFAGVKDPLIARAKPYFEKGLIKSPEDLRNFANEGPKVFEKQEAKEVAPTEEIKKPKNAEIKSSEKAEEGIEWKYTREDFPTRVEAQEYLDHLNRQLAKTPFGHRATAERDIENLQDLVRGFEREEATAPAVQPKVMARPRKPKVKTKAEQTQDTRRVVNEIHDLKKQLQAAIGSSEKNRITREINEKAHELQKLRKPLVAIPEKQVEVSPKKLKSQKDYFVDTLEDAIAHPTDAEFVTVKVPDDGVFRIPNVNESLEEALKRVKKDWPVKQVSAKPPEHEYKAKIKGEPFVAEKVEEKEVPPLASRAKRRQTPPPSTAPRRPVMGKAQAVARSKIIKLFRTAFKDPIRLGKIKMRNAAGIHKLWPRVTRLLRDNDVETAAHEIGHNLHTALYGGDAKSAQEQVKNINAALHPYLNELKPLAHYEPWGMEGFAEFTRMYVTNPNVAQQLAPKFFAKFEADLEAKYPEMKNALLDARDYYEQYLQGTPESRIRAQTSYANDKGKLASIIEAVKAKFNPDKLKTEWLDDVFPAKRLVSEAFGIPLSEVEGLKDSRNLYRTLRVLKGAVGKGDVFVLHETFDPLTLDKINGSLRDILKQLPNEEAYREFNDYLIARRAIEKTAQKVETGINAGDAIAVEQKLRPKYGKLAKELDKYNDALLQYAAKSGLISNQQYATIKKNNLMYTPFQRVMEQERGGIAAGGGKVQAGKPIKRMKGSTRDIIAPVESILKNTYAVIVNAEKNMAGKVLAELARMKGVGAYVEAVPTPTKLKGKIEGEQVANELAKRFEREGLSDLIEYDQDGKPVLREDIADAIPEVFLRFGAGKYPQGEDIVTVYFEGKPKYYEVSPELYEMWTKGIAPYTASLITKILRFPASTLRAGAILNPKFMQKNFIRDTWGSWLFTKYGKGAKDPAGLLIDTLYSPFAMMATAAKKGPLYVEWMKAGGGMGTMQSLDRDHVVKKLDEVRHGLKPHQVIRWLRSVAEISEEANRLAEFGRALAVEGKTRLGREIAAFAGRDLSIDFAKIGLQTKALNQIIPFWNATVQGGDKLLRTLFNPEDRKNFLPRVVGFIVLPSLILAWLNKDDENVKEFHEEEKDFNFITKVGDSYIKIPVPFETGVLAHGMTQRMFNYFMQKDPEAFEKFMGSVMDAMLPNMIPTMANPFIETWANKNFFTGGRIIPRNKEDLIAKYQYKDNTSPTARLIGRAMTYMLGQETRSKAASPAIIDHFITSWTGGFGGLIVKVADASLETAGLSNKIPGPKQAITERLGLDAFTARFPRTNTRSIEKFYDNYAEATAHLKSLKHAGKMEIEPEEELEAGYRKFEKIHDYESLQQAYKAMQNCQRGINAIWNNPEMSPEIKKQMIDDLYLQMIDFSRKANEDIREYRLAEKD